MKKLASILLPAFAVLCIATAAPQTASARDYSSSYSGERWGNRDHDRGWHKGWRNKKHCRTVTVRRWSEWRDRWVYTQKRVCRR
jgi:hypothetical protein